MINESMYIDTSKNRLFQDNEVYKLHKEFIPFVGKQYDKTKVLLIGDYHYASDADNEIINNSDASSEQIVEDWYAMNTEEFNKSYGIKDIKYYNTINVVTNYLSYYIGNAFDVFVKPAQVIREVSKGKFKTDAGAFGAIAFYNYFQRPVFKLNEKVKSNKKDDEVAYKTLIEINNILKPDILVFLSKKAYSSFIKQNKALDSEINLNKIKWVYHPSSKWWKNKGIEDICGKDSFKLIMEEINFNALTKTNDERQELFNLIWLSVIEKLKENNCEVIYNKEQINQFYCEKKNNISLKINKNVILEIKDCAYLYAINDKKERLYLPYGQNNKLNKKEMRIRSKAPVDFKKYNFAYRLLYNENKREEFIDKIVTVTLSVMSTLGDNTD